VGAPETPEQELRRLRRENASLKQERDWAKKVAVYFAKESR
jgi:transposase-like protein